MAVQKKYVDNANAGNILYDFSEMLKGLDIEFRSKIMDALGISMQTYYRKKRAFEYVFDKDRENGLYKFTNAELAGIKAVMNEIINELKHKFEYYESNIN